MDLKLRTNDDRPEWDEFFMFSAIWGATRSSCHNLNTAATIVKDKRIKATGYNGAPSGIKNSIERGYCSKLEQGVNFDTKGSGTCIGEHGERNAMNQISREEAEGSTMYTYIFPCTPCTKTIIGKGIKRVVYCKVYKEKESLAQKLLDEAGVQVDQMDIDIDKMFSYVKKLR